MRLLLLAVAALLVAAAIVLWFAQQRWNAATAELQQRLIAAPTSTPPAVFSARQLDGLPAPVARHLKQVLRDGQPMIRSTRIAWRGEFNMGAPGADNWKPLEATQLYSVDPPGFVWDARITLLPGVAARVRDAFVGGEGSMLGRVAALITVVDRAGSAQISTAALQRYLGEAIWFPTALLPSQGVRWTPIDEHNARASIDAGGITTSVDFHFGADGLVESVAVADRLFDDGKSPPRPLPWRARVLRWRQFDGIKLPAEAVAEWQFPDRVYAYWRGEAVGVEHE